MTESPHLRSHACHDVDSAPPVCDGGHLGAGAAINQAHPGSFHPPSDHYDVPFSNVMVSMLFKILSNLNFYLQNTLSVSHHYYSI